MILIALAASSGGEPANARVLVLDPTTDENNADTARLVVDLVSTAASRVPGHEVVTAKDLQQVLELEANKQAVGCDTTSSSCLAEIAGAMGAQLVVFGSVGNLGDTALVTLTLFDAEAARSRGRETLRAKDLSELPDMIDGAVARLFGAAPTKQASSEGETGSRGFGVLGWSGVGLSLTGAGLAVAGFGVAWASESALSDPTGDGGAKVSTRELGVLGVVVGGIGVATLAAGGALVGLEVLGE